MRTVIQRFLSFHAENVTPEVYYSLGVVYLILLAVSIFSLIKSPMRGKPAWLLVMLLLPVVGMYAYTLVALLKSDFSFLARFGLSGSKTAAQLRGNT
jgi:hypothetical protein